MTAPVMPAGVFIALMVALAVLDGASTYYILKRGGVEKNPVVAFLVKAFGLYAGLWVAKLAMVSGAIYYADAFVRQPKYAVGLLALYGFAAAWNFRQIHIYRTRKAR